jgi:hypothetical protein
MVSLAMFALAVVAGACGNDSGDDPTPTPRGTATLAGLNATPTGSDDTPAGSAIVEVTGIVGAVSTTARAIEINRLSGASVNRIEVAPATTIRSAGGHRVALQDIRPSERIIARGPLNERGDAIVANDITVQDVVPGAPGSSPGG